MKLVFMGTPEFAVPCLEALANSHHTVAAVISQPDKPKGRGYQMQPTPVKAAAERFGIEVYQPQTLKDGQAADKLRELAPDVIVVVAYGKLLPQEILQIPPKGCINVHGSLLPRYRGAGPIQWSVLNGETQTGVTTMYMAQGLDTGDMILQQCMEIGENETASQLHDRMAIVGAKCLMETLEQIEQGTAVRIPQNDELASYAPMLSREMSQIDFDKSAQLVHNQIRGLSAWPCASTTLLGKRLKVYQSCVADGVDTVGAQPGTLLDQKQFIVACKQGAVQFLQVQYEGAKRMDATDFLRGKRVEKGTVLG